MSLWSLGLNKKQKPKERTWLLLGMVGERVYYREKGECRMRQGRLEESSVDMTRLNWATGEVGRERRRERRGPGTVTRRAKIQKVWVVKMSGIYREEQPSSLAWRVQSRGQNTQARRTL